MRTKTLLIFVLCGVIPAAANAATPQNCVDMCDIIMEKSGTFSCKFAVVERYVHLTITQHKKDSTPSERLAISSLQRCFLSVSSMGSRLIKRYDYSDGEFYCSPNIRRRTFECEKRKRTSPKPETPARELVRPEPR